MTQTMLTRRALLTGFAALGLSALLPRLGQAATAGAVHVMRDPNCGCCSAWVDILERDGFTVTTEASAGTALSRYKAENGIPAAMASCHTARVEGYMIEGHVPAADIRRLLADRPDAVGLAVPGMPYGSPGMGPETEREAYEVFLIRRDGSTEVFSRYDAA